MNTNTINRIPTPLRPLLCALPATAAAGLAFLLPDPVRPPLVAWVTGVAVISIAVCAAAGRYAWVGLSVLTATSLGMLTQLRLGAPALRLAVLGVAAALAFTAAIRIAQSRSFARWLTGSSPRRLLSLSLMGAALGLRGVTVLGKNPVAGTLPGLPVQIGEATRYLAAAGIAVAITELAACRRGMWLPQDQQFRVLAWSLLGLNVACLVGLKDFGPATLLLVGVAVAAVHVRGLRARWVVGIAAGAAALAPLIATSSTIRTRLHEIFAPGPQLTAALHAGWSGGLLGPGPGRSGLVAGIPAISFDYAMIATLADDGVIIVVPVVICLLFTFAALIRTAATHSDTPASVAVTVTAMLAAQAAWSTLGQFAIAPLTGLNDPFIAVSGAALITSAAVLGMTMGILMDEAPVTGEPAPGTAVIQRVSALGTAAVSLMTVVVAGMLAFSTQQLDGADKLRLPRGRVLTSDLQIISADGPEHVRVYPSGDHYYDIGYSKWNFTQRGLDSTQADALTCGGHLSLLDWLSAVLHPVCNPADVVSTINSHVQQALASALEGQVGEAAVLDTATSSVLGLYSSPATARGAPSAARLSAGPPGSTQKIVTTSAAIMNHVNFDQAPATVLITADGQHLPNDGGEVCPATDPRTALAYSCNSVEGWAAIQIGAAELQRIAATYFGADQPFKLEGGDAIGLSTGLLGHSAQSSPGALARAGIGQESVRSNPLGTALATIAIANAGIRPTHWPSLTAAVCAGGDPELPAPTPPIGPQLPKSVGQIVYEGMRRAVSEGTARRLKVPSGMEVAVKTGAAEVGTGIDSWITAIVDHRYVLTLVVHGAAREGAATVDASSILPALQAPVPPISCPAAPGANNR